MNKDKIYSLLGLCKKAGCAQGGEFLAEKSVKSGRSFLVIIAQDSSDNTKKKFRDMCSFYKVPYFEFGDKDGLGHSIGTEFRASVSISNQGLAAKIIGLLNTEE